MFQTKMDSIIGCGFNWFTDNAKNLLISLSLFVFFS